MDGHRRKWRMTGEEKIVKAKNKGMKRFVYALLFLFVFLPLFLFLLVNIPSVQNFLVNKYSDKLSKTTGTDVSIGHLDLNIYKGLVSEGVSLVNPESKDTLLSIDKLTIGLKENLFYVFRDRLSLQNVGIDGLTINLVKGNSQETTSLEEFFSKLSSNKKKENNKEGGIKLNLEKINLQNFKLNQITLDNNSNRSYALESATLNIKEFDLKNNSVIIDDFIINKPFVHISEGLKIDDQILEETEQSQKINEVVNDFRFDSLGMEFVINNTSINNGRLILMNEKAGKINTSKSFDSNNFSFEDITMNMQDFSISDQGLHVKLNDLNAINTYGYDLNNVSGDILINDRQATMSNFDLKTQNSSVKNDLTLKYRKIQDFADITNKVILDSKFDRTKISFREVNYYLPVLAKQSFFQKNQNRTLSIQGNVKGKINNLSGRNIELAIDDKIKLKGKFDTRDLTVPDHTLINLQCDELISDIYSFKQIFPAFNPPENYYKLGDINFSGRFDGFYYDFVAFGDLKTSLGSADLDMRLDLKEGRDFANYSGVLNLNQFDLATWLENDDVGLISLQSKVIDGKGLTLKNAFADLNAEIISFRYKDYLYNDIKLTGQLDKSRFNGDLEIHNDDVNFNFTGNLEFEDNVFVSDFVAKIDKLDLYALNISKKPLSISGDIESQATGTGFDDFIGEAEFGDLQLIVEDSLYVFDTLYINSSPDELGNRNANVISESFQVSIDGDFDLAKLPEVIKWQISKNHPYYAKKLKIPANIQLSRHQDMSFKANIEDSRNYLDLLGLEEANVKDFNISGSIDTEKEFLSFESSLNSFQRKDMIGYNLELDLLNKKEQNKIVANFDSLSLFNRQFDDIHLDVNMVGDYSEFSIDTKNLADSLQALNLKGSISPEGEGIKITFQNDKWEMFSSNWNFANDNSIIIKDDYVQVNNLSMTDGYRIIVIDDIQSNTGVDLSLRNFDFKLIDGLINYDKIRFTGEGDVDISCFNIFEEPSFDLKLVIPEFMLNDISYGEASIDIHTRNQDIISSVLIENDIHSIKVFGTYNLESNFVDASLKANGFQMKFFEDFILTDGISQTGGLANVYVDIKGPIDDIKFGGDAIIHQGSVKIDYLGNLIRYDKQRLKITENYIDLTDFEIIDIEGNVGTFTGGLHHDYVSDFVVEVDAKADRFVGLNTTKADNPLYYGYGVGEMDIEFRGPFSSNDIKINATTGTGTEINIPVTDYQEGYEDSFITFIDSSRHRLTDYGFESYIPGEFKLEGVDVEMNLDITPDANLSIIFNEKVNDIIRGTGEGDIRVLLKRTGEFDVFGVYEVFGGEYLFTAWDLIAKPFTVKRGGLIKWTGDPVNAELNIEASYENLRAPLSVFLSEYLNSASQDVRDLARDRTEVDLTMKLTGQLYQPDVSFDLDFPNLIGDLRSFATNKVNTLRQNESELNNQVVGLLVFNTFLPTTNNLNSDIYNLNNAVSTTVNTVSEFVSTQLSYILSGFLQEALEENGFISGIDFDIGFNSNTLYDLSGFNNSTNIAPDEVEVNLRNRFFDDRWELNLGGNFGRQNASNIINNYIIGDFVITYYLTEDRRLRLSGYGKYDIDEINQQREQKYGFGINYRKEFGSLIELKEAISEDTKKLSEKTTQNASEGN